MTATALPQPENDQEVVLPLSAEALAAHVTFIGRLEARAIQIVAVPAPSELMVALTTATAAVSDTMDAWDAEERGEVVDQRKGLSTVEPPPGTRSQWEQVERSK
jgi:hypothetical protein